MNRYLIKIAFDGTSYHGFQVQPNGVTVQSTLMEALKKLTGENATVTGCSRTDAGVHAREFYFHTDISLNLPQKAFIKGLNSLLPDDIKVLGAKKTENTFHARYNVSNKTYEYGFYLGKEDPFLHRYYLHLDKEPSVKLMNKFCKSIIGTHDFCGFSSAKRTVLETVRTVYKCKTRIEDNKIIFSITADGFLYNMVRILAGTALAVGYGRLPIDTANKVFSTNNRSLGGDTLSPKGLFLTKVIYKK